MRRLTFVFRSHLFDAIGSASSGEAPRDFLWGMSYFIQKGNRVEHVNAPRLQRRRGIRLVTWLPESLFARVTRIGLPIEIYPLFRSTLDNAENIICVNDQISLGLAFWRLLGRLRDKKLIFIIMALPERRKYFLKWQWPRKFIRNLLLQAEIVLTVSRFDDEILNKFYEVPESRIHYVGFGVDTEYWKPPATPLVRRHIFSFGNDMNRDYLLLADSVPPDVCLRVVTRRRLQFASPLHSAIGNWLEYDELRKMIWESVAVVIPSVPLETEPSGLSSALQAMASGALVIVPDNPALVGEFGGHDICVFYEAGSRVSLTRAIQDVWTAPEKYEDFSRRAVRFTRENFALDNFGARIERAID